VQLSENQTAFQTLGLNVAAFSIDPNEVALKFTKKHSINYPLMQDKEGKLGIQLGIRNEDYPPGHRAYGIPHPGIYLLDKQGIIQGKFAEENYRDRPAFEDILQAAKTLLTNSPTANPAP